MRRQQASVVTSVNKVMQRGPVPEAHQSKRKKKTKIRPCLIVFEPFTLHRGEKKSHVNVIAKPERKSDVPAIPEIANIMS